MKSIITIFILTLASLAYSQEIKTEIIIFTEITVDQAEGGSFYMEYTDSKGEIHYSDMRFDEDIFVDLELMYDYEDGLLIYFNEKHAKECIGKTFILRYYDEDIKYFGTVPHVVDIMLKD